MAEYLTIEGRAEAAIEEKKSRFIAQLSAVRNEEEALAFLQEICSKHRLARHNAYAYILREENGVLRIRHSDDGEPSKTAGLPILNALQHAGLVCIAAVVTRYFGGVLLGTGGLARAYTQATQAAIANARILSMSTCIDIELQVDYPLYEKLLILLACHNAKLLESRFSEHVVLQVRILEGTQDAFLEALRELCHGAERLLSVSKPVFAAL